MYPYDTPTYDIYIAPRKTPEPTRTPGAEGMSFFHQRLLIDAFMHVCTPEQRQFLMKECPAAYNDYCGRKVD